VYFKVRKFPISWANECKNKVLGRARHELLGCTSIKPKDFQRHLLHYSPTPVTFSNCKSLRTFVKGLIESHRFASMTEILGNIILVGETGTGKSSIINMIAGHKVAEISSRATGCTFQHQAYYLPVHSRYFTIYDTAGLNEGDNLKGTVNRTAAIAELYKLIIGLDGGINLLVFCMRGPRIKNATHENWKVFHDILCKKKVPTVLIVTGLENEENMDEWWWTNRGTFEEQGIRPDATACITATRGRVLKDGSRAFDEQYEESRAKVTTTIINNVLRHRHKFNKNHWLYDVFRGLLHFFGLVKTCEAADIQQIVDTCGMSGEEARRFKEDVANK